VIHELPTASRSLISRLKERSDFQKDRLRSRDIHVLGLGHC